MAVVCCLLVVGCCSGLCCVVIVCCVIRCLVRAGFVCGLLFVVSCLLVIGSSLLRIRFCFLVMVPCWLLVVVYC